jgi:hypothetical protein
MQTEIAVLIQEHQAIVCPLLALAFALAAYASFSAYSKIPIQPLSGWGIVANLGGLLIGLFGVLFVVLSLTSLTYLADSWYFLGVLICPEVLIGIGWLICKAFGGCKTTEIHRPEEKASAQ